MKQSDTMLVILHEFKLGRNVFETVTNVNQAWCVGTTSDRKVCRLFSNFHGGNVDIDHQPITGRLVLCNTVQLTQEMEETFTFTVRELSFELAVSPATVSRHLAAMGKVKIVLA